MMVMLTICIVTAMSTINFVIIVIISLSVVFSKEVWIIRRYSSSISIVDCFGGDRVLSFLPEV